MSLSPSPESSSQIAPLDAALTLRAAGDPARVWVGTMNFGKRTSEKEARAILTRADELGIRYVDTANAYNDGAAERIVGEATRKNRERWVVATKCGFARVGGKPEGLRPERILAALEESLRRLKTDWVDLYYLHVPDHGTPIESTLDAIADLLEQKKIRAWGVSNYGAWQVLEMIHLADARGIPRPRVAQQLYNVLVRQLDIEYFSFARRYRVATMVFNPLAGGLLTGRHERDGSTQRGSRFDGNRLYQDRYFTPAMFDRLRDLGPIAHEQDLTLLQLAYAWVASEPAVDSILLGPATVSHIDEGVENCQRVLSAEVRGRIRAAQQTWEGTNTAYVR